MEFNREEVWQGRVRRYFQLTGSGEQHLATEPKRLATTHPGSIQPAGGAAAPPARGRIS